MNQNDLHLRLNHHQLELIQKIRKEHKLADKSNNEVLRFIIEDYDKQTQELKKAKELINTKLNFISQETFMTLNSLLNLMNHQNIEIKKSNDQMIQYYQADKQWIGHTDEEIEKIKRKELDERRKAIAKKINESSSSLISKPSDSPFDFLDENPF